MSRGRIVLALVALNLVACPPPAPPPPPTPLPLASASAAAPVMSASAAPTASAAPRIPAPAPDASPPADLGRAACKKGDRAACDTLAEYWGAREFLPPGRDAEARGDGEILKVACETHNLSSACMGVALMLKYGTATGQRDSDAAKPYWEKVTRLADLNGFRGGPSEEGRAALSRAQQECDEGRSRACNQLGWAAYSGVQREASIADSYRSYAEGCRLGSALGCRWAGHLAFTYPEIQETKSARGLLERGCKGDNPSACAELGQYADKFESGAKAPLFFEQSCAAGSRDGCFFGGKRMLEQGKAQRKEGAALLKKACDAEQEEACDLAGPLLERGDGLPRDEGAAIVAYQRGCKGKQLGSCEALSRLAGGGKGPRCVLDPKKPSRIGEPGVKALKQACKEHDDAPWCKGITGCP